MVPYDRGPRGRSTSGATATRCTTCSTQFAFARSAAGAEPLDDPRAAAAARGDLPRPLVPARPALEQRAVRSTSSPPGRRRGCTAAATTAWPPAARCRKRYGGSWLDRGRWRLLVFYLDRQTRLLIVKDFRTFRRDPAQWGQVLIFAGLMLLYFVNIRRSSTRATSAGAYQHGISFTEPGGHGACCMCAYMGRFIYPLLSLEGRKFWILGLLPLEREQLLWGKFAFAATGGAGRARRW